MIHRVGVGVHTIIAHHIITHSFASPDASLIKQHGGGLRTYAALLNHILIAIARDPFAWPFLNKNNNDAHSAVSLPTGGVKVTPVMFMDTIAALQPDVFVALADEIMAEAGYVGVVGVFGGVLGLCAGCVGIVCWVCAD